MSENIVDASETETPKPKKVTAKKTGDFELKKHDDKKHFHRSDEKY